MCLKESSEAGSYSDDLVEAQHTRSASASAQEQPQINWRTKMSHFIRPALNQNKLVQPSHHSRSSPHVKLVPLKML